MPEENEKTEEELNYYKQSLITANSRLRNLESLVEKLRAESDAYKNVLDNMIKRLIEQK